MPGGPRSMSYLTSVTEDGAAAQRLANRKQDFIPLIRRAMDDRGIRLRELGLRTGMSKSRLGLLLHGNAAKRPVMDMREFQCILGALGIDLIQAIICVETLREDEFLHSARYATLIPMLCEMFRQLPADLISALEKIEGFDGTEIRREWADGLRRAVIKRIVLEASKVASRRSEQSDFNLLT
jgi:transcriptional regulator with XRE-family HTH domain